MNQTSFEITLSSIANSSRNSFRDPSATMLSRNMRPMKDVIKLLKFDNNQAAEFAKARCNTGGLQG